ncbi:28025_t:CDS:2, partial [Racocetra persica]
MSFKYSINNMSATALIEADLNEIIEAQYYKEDYLYLSNAKFEEMINITDDFLITQENVNNINHTNKNNVVDELSKNENINNTNEDISKNITFNTWEEVEIFLQTT